MTQLGLAACYLDGEIIEFHHGPCLGEPSKRQSYCHGVTTLKGHTNGLSLHTR
jgi:hypothetical protein